MTTSLGGTVESSSRRVGEGTRWCKSHCVHCDRCFASDPSFDANIRHVPENRHIDLAVEHVGTTTWELAPVAGKCQLWNGWDGTARDTTLWERVRIVNAR